MKDMVKMNVLVGSKKIKAKEFEECGSKLKQCRSSSWWLYCKSQEENREGEGGGSTL
jgi:hypothetical protein